MLNNANRLAAAIKDFELCKFQFQTAETKAMIRHRYNRIPHPALKTKRESDINNYHPMETVLRVPGESSGVN